MCHSARNGTSPDVSEAAYFDCATVKNSQHNSEVQSFVGAGPSGKTFAGAAHRQGANIEDLELRPKVLQTQYGNIHV